MYNGKKILALITARGGSKGIPGKNIKPLAGKPLINWTIESGLKSRYIDRLILSSDSDEIITTAQKAGCETPFKRPVALASDTSSSMDVIIHALNLIEGDYDYLLLLQPTSPFRTNLHIDSIIKKSIDNNSLSSVSVSRVKKHPAFFYSLEDNKLIPLLSKRKQTRRQDMPPVYECNGALYFTCIDFLKKERSFNTGIEEAFIMDPKYSLDLDENLDWKIAESFVEKGIIK
ncbi:hypothetical protein HVA01_03550 [Halovibrio variabilis]|uniref:Acylneuraminate cytidylyltransferase n=1 Tax=Halovibrio variabilis TaxID=31910 RepID=A0A511UJE9_9GAMM|nr:acylneuraminate cytidylyltransferase family protein [Halovibrio variabilis]GEN26709.1 hypothetical protein HVA01_03550 [Halovibrio variabilis]